ncbi:hypothetical protein PTKIN_Ptkin02bG0220800 [Pterospermum kingtungense]
MEGHHAEGDNNKTTVNETTDRGLFDFMKKKDEDVAVSEDGHKPDNVKEKLHRSNSSSSSSSDEEEVGEDGEKKKKKKGLKDKIKDKISGDKEAPDQHADVSIPAENPEEKKGFLDKIKEKLPGHQHKNAEDVGANEGHHHAEGDDQPKEKGILEKIKEKIPGYHGHKAEEDKPKEN